MPLALVTCTHPCHMTPQPAPHPTTGPHTLPHAPTPYHMPPHPTTCHITATCSHPCHRSDPLCHIPTPATSPHTLPHVPATCPTPCYIPQQVCRCGRKCMAKVCLYVFVWPQSLRGQVGRQSSGCVAQVCVCRLSVCFCGIYVSRGQVDGWSSGWVGGEVGWGSSGCVALVCVLSKCMAKVCVCVCGLSVCGC